ncbi:MAG: hypothetical protein V4493_01320 [Pseudomonadota bacterium]
MADRLEARAKSFNKIASDKAVAATLVTLNVLYERTPVDTSAAVSNWQVSLNSPISGFISPYVPGFLGYTASASIAIAKQVAIGILQNKKPGQVIYITNNAPYIRGLNSGTSKQDPGGFVEAAALIARKSLAN